MLTYGCLIRVIAKIQCHAEKFIKLLGSSKDDCLQSLGHIYPNLPELFSYSITYMHVFLPLNLSTAKAEGI